MSLEYPDKRQMILAAPSQGSQKRISFYYPSADSQDVDTEQKEAPPSSQTSQNTTKANGSPSSLSFPVLQNPRHLDTTLSLSQTGLANSRQ